MNSAAVQESMKNNRSVIKLNLWRIFSETRSLWCLWQGIGVDCFQTCWGRPLPLPLLPFSPSSFFSSPSLPLFSPPFPSPFPIPKQARSTVQSTVSPPVRSRLYSKPSMHFLYFNPRKLLLNANSGYMNKTYNKNIRWFFTLAKLVNRPSIGWTYEPEK